MPDTCRHCGHGVSTVDGALVCDVKSCGCPCFQYAPSAFKGSVGEAVRQWCADNSLRVSSDAIFWLVSCIHELHALHAVPDEKNLDGSAQDQAHVLRRLAAQAEIGAFKFVAVVALNSEGYTEHHYTGKATTIERRGVMLTALHNELDGKLRNDG